jgi:RNA polymerase sigma-70 factor (ECF subfamily)
MATTVADINYAKSGAVHLYQERVQELSCLISRSLPYLHRTALRRVSNVADAEDVVQDALLSALTHVDQFRGQAQMSTWLISILINSARMKLRRRPRQLHLSLDEKNRDQDDWALSELVPDGRPGPEDICRAWELSDLLVPLMKRLSPALRQTLKLRTVDGLSIRETANIMRVPEGTVKARMTRARTRLKQMVQDHIGRKRARSEGRRRPFSARLGECPPKFGNDGQSPCQPSP